jgi:TonB family protein
MIASWMFFASAIAALLGAAALAASSALAAARRPTRSIWLAALLASIIWPLVALGFALFADVHGAAFQLLELTTSAAEPRVLAAPCWISGAATAIDPLLIGVWALATLALLVQLARALLALKRQRASWRPFAIDGVGVRLSRDTGPAVIGVRSMDIVLPEWALTLEPRLLRMILRHEAEHRRCQDPRILFMTSVAVALLPWNPALWWCAHRLRLAMELDCDARVIASHADRDRYGLLLMLLSQYPQPRIARFAAALTNPTSNLERRIIAMRTTASKSTRTRVLAFSTLAALLIAVACSVDSPEAVKPHGEAIDVGMAAPGPINDTTAYFEYQVEQPVTMAKGNPAPVYPKALEKAHVAGTVLVQFVVSTDGRPEMKTFEVLKSSNGLFTDAVRDVLPNLHFVPAEVGGEKVRQLVQMPFGFRIPETT